MFFDSHFNRNVIWDLFDGCSKMKTKKSKLRKLVEEADKLYQIKFIRENPTSIISGDLTEVAHHFIPKSQSNNLRYDEENGIPLTNGEHCRHHRSGDPSIVARILAVKGQKWFDGLQLKRREICKFYIGYLKSIIDKLNGN